MMNDETIITNMISRIQAAIEDSPVPKFGSADRRIVDAGQLQDMLVELKTSLPENVRKANSVLLEANTMLEEAEEHAKCLVADAEQSAADTMADAQNKADEIILKAREERERLIEESEIIAEAKKRAEAIRRKAAHNANLMFDNAAAYSDEVLGTLMHFLEEYYAMIEANRDELNAKRRPRQGADGQAETAAEVPKEAEEGEGFFSFFKRRKKAHYEEHSKSVDE